MKKGFETAIKGMFVILGLCLIFLFANEPKARAIVFGQEVTSASTSYPYVVSVWWAEDQDTDFQHACTGTLISDRLVVTAAHCIFDEGLMGIGYGDDQLYDKTPMRRVSAVWKHPRFSNKQKVNDIGLILLEERLSYSEPLALPTKSQLSSVIGKSGTTYEILGWGRNQNDEQATYLRKAIVSDQTSLARTIKGWQPWRNEVWFAVGKWLPKERVFAGACYGDSGGPLIAVKNKKTYFAGVASWGSQDCETNRPSVYTRLSYYLSDLKTGMSQIYINEQKQNRSLPSVITSPSISGDISSQGRVFCNQGVWSSGTESIDIKWTLNGTYFATGASIRLGAGTTSDQIYKCIVTGTNANGSYSASAQITLPAKPFEISRPAVQGVPTTTFFSSNTTAACTPAVFRNAKTTESAWWIGSSSFGYPEEKISTEKNILIDLNFAIKYGGKYLSCVTSAFGDGGINISYSFNYQIPRLATPSFDSLPRIAGVSALRSINAGDIAKCDSWKALGFVQSSTVSWYVSSYFVLGSNSFTPRIGDKTELVITSDILSRYRNQYIFCEVTLTNQVGAITRVSDFVYLYSSQVTTTPTPTPTPARSQTPTPSLTPTPTPTPIPTPTPSPSTTVSQSTAQITGVTITSSSADYSPKSGTIYTCDIETTNNNYRGIYIKWRNSNLPEPGSYKSPFQEREWNGGLFTTPKNTLTVSAEMISDLQGNYLECTAIVYAVGGGQTGGWVSKKIKLP